MADRRIARWTRAAGARGALLVRRLLLAAADAVVPPQLALFEQVIGIGRTELLHATARLRLPDMLAAGPRSVADLARSAAVDAPVLARALRALASGGVFTLRDDGRVENSRLSEGFRTGAPGSMRDFLVYFGSPANVRAWEDFGATLRTGGSAFARVHGRSVWSWFEQHPEEGRTFAAALARLAEMDANAIAGAHAFDRLRRICDVAGGEGAVLAEILTRAPHLTAVLLDRPDVVARARAFLARRGVGDRVDCEVGDFFARIPRGCDAYLLKDVLHDWDDPAALRILRACRRAARPGALLMVFEMLLEPHATESPAAWVDLQMLTVTEGGRQRSRREMTDLLQRAGWTPRAVRRLPGLLSLVVAIRPPTDAARRRVPRRASSRDAAGGAPRRGGSLPRRRRPARPTA